MKVQRLGSFEDISWRDFGAMVQNTVLGLDALAINKGDNVAIVGDNSLPRLCADLATLAGGLPNVMISPNVSDVTLLKILMYSRCRAVFIDLIDAPRLLALKAQLPNLSQVIVLTTVPKSLPALCRLPSCWNKAGAVTSADSINFWKQSSQMT